MNILFMCVANSARSQMAEGLARKLYPEHTFLSAGSEPSTVNPFALRALKELGIDAQSHSSKSVNTIDLTKINAVITLCAEEVCPLLPGKVRRIHWPFKDPAGLQGSDEEKLECFRTARDAIEKKLAELPAYLANEKI